MRKAQVERKRVMQIKFKNIQMKVDGREEQNGQDQKDDDTINRMKLKSES